MAEKVIAHSAVKLPDPRRYGPGDPGHPLQLLAQLKGVDNLHLNDAGYQAMANAVNLALLRR